MHQIAHKLWVGSQADFEELDAMGTGWAVVHAAKEPWHREALGYKGRSAPADHPEYLVARRGDRLILNLVDAPDPKYISRTVIDTALRFIADKVEEFDPLNDPRAVLICCNQGQSRSPTIGLLYLASHLPENFVEAEVAYRELCPSYAPGEGMRAYARIHWGRYHHSRNSGGRPDVTLRDVMDAPLIHAPTHLDRAEGIWQRLCETLKTDPALARDQLVKTLVDAFSAAGTQQERSHGQGYGPPDDDPGTDPV